MGIFISAAMIVKNEERTIVRCLSSIVNVTDEIIIVDTGSTDRTIELIEEFRQSRKNIRLYHFKWINDFAAARNFALSKTRGTWKFIIDADEFLHSEDAPLLLQYCKKISDAGAKAFIGSVDILNLVGGEVREKVVFGVSRLLLGKFKYKGKIHEYLTHDYDYGVTNANLGIRLCHDGYDADLVDMTRKGLRNIKLIEQMLQEEPENYLYRVYFAVEACNINLEVAVSAIRRAEELYRYQFPDRQDIEDKFLLEAKKRIFAAAGL